MSEHGSATLQLQYDPDPSTPRAVRREFTRQYETHPCLEALLLCLSEVVTNAVLHARTRVHVTVSGTGDRVRVEVADGSPVKPVRRAFVEVSPTGRGLHLLDRLASSWGIEMTEDGKTVWFEIESEPPS